jgi:hypothetical protein
MMTQDRIEMLKRLVQRPLTIINLPMQKDLKIVQELVRLGYARDYGNQWGRRVPVRLRIWGITDAGRAVLEQQSLAENKNDKQLAFTMLKKPSLTIKPCVRVKTHQNQKRRKVTAVTLTTPTGSPITSEEPED